MKRNGRPETLVKDRSRCKGAGLGDPGRDDDRKMKRRLNTWPDLAPAGPTAREGDLAAQVYVNVARVGLSPVF